MHYQSILDALEKYDANIADKMLTFANARAKADRCSVADIFHHREKLEKARSPEHKRIEAPVIKYITRILTAWKVVERLLMEREHRLGKGEEEGDTYDSDEDSEEAYADDACPRQRVYPFKEKVSAKIVRPNHSVDSIAAHIQHWKLDDLHDTVTGCRQGLERLIRSELEKEDKGKGKGKATKASITGELARLYVKNRNRNRVGAIIENILGAALHLRLFIVYVSAGVIWLVRCD